jgi:hypothetical protein
MSVYSPRRRSSPTSDEAKYFAAVLELAISSCHKGTIVNEDIVCRGFYDEGLGHDRPNQALQIASRLGLAVFIEQPDKEMSMKKTAFDYTEIDNAILRVIGASVTKMRFADVMVALASESLTWPPKRDRDRVVDGQLQKLKAKKKVAFRGGQWERIDRA